MHRILSKQSVSHHQAMFLFFRAERKVGFNNGGGTGSIGSSSSGLGSSGGLLSGGDSEINGTESSKVKRENILSELQLTESRYTDDLEQVLRNYRYHIPILSRYN